jgi:hypothetical protein
MDNAIKMHRGFEDDEDHSRRIYDQGQCWPLKRILSGKRVATVALILWEEVVMGIGKGRI